MNHNVPLIGGVEQQEGREYRAEVLSAGEDGAQLDLTAAYPKEAGAKAIIRSFALSEEGVTLSDSIALDEAKEVTWVFMLRKPPVCEAGKVTFGPLALHHDAALTQHVTEMPVTDVRLKKNFPGSLWRLALTAKAASTFEQHFTITRS